MQIGTAMHAIQGLHEVDLSLNTGKKDGIGILRGGERLLQKSSKLTKKIPC